jgi:hypothetical protein
MKKTRGVGSIFLRKGSDVYHFKFYHHGKPVRGSCGVRSEPEARRVLKAKISQAGIGNLPTAAARRTTIDALRKLVLADYCNNGYDTAARQDDAFDHLKDFLGADCPADEITSARIEEYKVWRRQQPDGRALKRQHDHLYRDKPVRMGCANATLNRELAALRHALRLAARETPPLVTNVPHIAMLKERNRRTGFFEWEEFEAVRQHLPDYLKPVMTVAYYTGWRTASELLSRHQKHIINGMLVLEADEAKNEQPRRFPLAVIPELRETVERQREATRKIELETGRVITLLFHNRGNPIVDYRPASGKACAAAGGETSA